MLPKKMLSIVLVVFACCSLALGRQAMADIIIPVQDQSQVDVTVESDVLFDAASGLYTYILTVTNGPLALQEVDSFVVEADAEILNIQSPEGWVGMMSFRKPRIAWGAVGFIDNTIPPEDDGNVFPSDVNIKPGQTLGGFLFQSPAGPTTVTFLAQGFAKIPQADSEDDFEGVEIPSFEENAFIGTTIGPGLNDDVIFTGGRRPAVDGFLGFVGVTADRAILAAPTAIVVRFAVNGETVDTSTFTATLNRVEVTGRFVQTGNADERIALFDLADSPLQIGRNVLRTSVNGVVPGTSRTAADGDALTFFIE